MNKIKEKIRIKLKNWLLYDEIHDFIIRDVVIGDGSEISFSSINLNLTGNLMLNGEKIQKGTQLTVIIK